MQEENCIEGNIEINKKYDEEFNKLKRTLEIEVKEQIRNIKEKYKSHVQSEYIVNLLLIYIENKY